MSGKATSNKKSKTIILIAIAVVICIGVVVAIIMATGNGNGDKSTGDNTTDKNDTADTADEGDKTKVETEIHLPGIRYIELAKAATGSINLAEVEVYNSNGQKLPIVSAEASSEDFGTSKEWAFDGNTSGNFGDKSMWHSDEVSPNQWISFDLGSEKDVSKIIVYGRDGFADRMNGVVVTFYDQTNLSVGQPHTLAAEVIQTVYTTI